MVFRYFNFNKKKHRYFPFSREKEQRYEQLTMV